MGRVRILMDVAPLRRPEFRRLWAAGAVTALGAQLTAVAVPVQVYALRGSSADVGLAALTGLAPMVAGALAGGAAADTGDRRRLLLATNGGIGAVSVLLWLQAAGHLRSLALLLLLTAGQQALFGANAAVSGAVVPRLVPVALLPAANALQSTAMWSAGVGGPLLAGALLPVLGAGPLYLADAAALCATLWAVRRLPPLPPVRAAAQRPGPRETVAGFRLLAADPVLRGVYLADFAALCLGLPTALFPQLARQVFGAGSLGTLYAALPLGCVLAGLCSGSFTRISRQGLGVGAAVCLWGLALAGVGLTRSPAVAAALLVVAGAALTVLSVLRKAVLQTAVTDDLRGRLQGADTVIAAGGPRLAGYAHGLAAGALGAPAAVTAGGLLAAAAMPALLLLSPAFRRYRPPAPRPPAPRPPGERPRTLPPRREPPPGRLRPRWTRGRGAGTGQASPPSAAPEPPRGARGRAGNRG